MPRPPRDLIGQQFGRFVVVERVRIRGRAFGWRCRCDCGEERLVATRALENRSSQSCGCLRREVLSKLKTHHGMSKTRIYRIWINVIRRCSDPNLDAFPNYGGRGIAVCDRWADFEKFYADMGDPPSNKHEIDRRNNDLGYSPDNCRWATRKEQCRNRRDNLIVQHQGQEISLAEFCERTGTSRSALEYRIYVKGQSAQQAIATPLRRYTKQEKSHAIN